MNKLERVQHIERHGESSTNNQEDCEGAGASLLQEKDERTRTSQPREENAQIGSYQGV